MIKIPLRKVAISLTLSFFMLPIFLHAEENQTVAISSAINKYAEEGKFYNAFQEMLYLSNLLKQKNKEKLLSLMSKAYGEYQQVNVKREYEEYLRTPEGAAGNRSLFSSSVFDDYSKSYQNKKHYVIVKVRGSFEEQSSYEYISSSCIPTESSSSRSQSDLVYSRIKGFPAVSRSKNSLRSSLMLKVCVEQLEVIFRDASFKQEDRSAEKLKAFALSFNFKEFQDYIK